MARVCEICGKGRVIGNNVSHANNKTKRKFMPNLQNIRITAGGTSKRIRACTRCIRSRLIQKQIRKSLSA